MEFLKAMQSTDNVILNIDIFISAGQMVCTACTGPVANAVKQFLVTENYWDESQSTVNAYHHEQTPANTVQIRNIIFSNHAHSLIELVEALVLEIDTVGFYVASYDVTINRGLINIKKLKQFLGSCDIETNQLKITDFLTLDVKTEQENKVAITTRGNRLSSDILLGGSALGLGITIMTLEHMNKMENPVLELALGCVSTAMTLFTGKNYFQNAIRRQGAMDTLISLGCGGAILYSFLLILQPPFLKDDTSSTFFDVPLMILGFLKFSHILRSWIESQIRHQENVVEELEKTLPHTVQLMSKETKAVSEVFPQTHIIVSAGEIIPIDGKLVHLFSEETIDVNEKFLTGNDREKVKKNGDTVYAGTINTTGKELFLETICMAEESQIYKILFAIRKKGETENGIEWVIKYFLRGVLSIATLSSLCWGLLGPEPRTSNAIQVFLSVILSACPCGLGLIPLNETLSKLLALEEGILIQKIEAFSMTDKVTDICIDKCGTLTTGEYEVMMTQSLSAEFTPEELFNYAVALQAAIPEKDRTAISMAILKKQSGDAYQATEYKENPANKGRGGQAIVNHKTVTIGNKALLNAFSISLEHTASSADPSNVAEQMLIYIAIEKQVVGVMTLQPVAEKVQILRPDFMSSIHELMQQGITVHIVTGDDSEENARNIAEKVITEIQAQIYISSQNKTQQIIGNEQDPILYITYGMQPQDKIEYIKTMQDNKKVVAMLGDGTNDRGAIQTANVGLVIDNDAPARNVSDAILNGSFISFIQLISLSKSYNQAYKTSMLIAFGTNVGLMATSAGVFYPLTKHVADPMFVGMGMTGSSLFLMMSIAIWQNIARQRKSAVLLSLTEKKSTSASVNSWCLLQYCCQNKQKNINSRRLLSQSDSDSTKKYLAQSR